MKKRTKRLKQLLTLSLAFVMVASTLTAVTAKSISQEADVLHQLGLFKGVSTVKYEPALDQQTDAAQALTLIGRALKWQVDLSDTTTKFKDVPTYAIPYIEKAVELGITRGVGETEFGVKYIDGRRMVAWLLRALGRNPDSAWENTEAWAQEEGITIPTGKTRGDVVSVIYDGLTRKPTNSDKTLIELIVGDNQQMKQIAIAANLMNQQATQLVIQDIKATNLREMVIHFNTELDPTSIEDKNFKVKKISSSTTISTVASLGEDKKSVIISPTGSGTFVNQAKYQVTINNVKSTHGLSINNETKECEVQDFNLPEVTDIKVTGPKNLTIIFNEPIKTKGTVKVASSTSNIGVNTSVTIDRNQVQIMLLSDMKDGVTYKVSTADFKDYSDKSQINSERTISYVKDNQPITAEVVKATEKHVQIEFNKPVKNLTKDYFYHSYSAWKPLNIYSDADMTKLINAYTSYKTVYVKFAESAADHPLPNKEVEVVILGKVGNKDIEDNWGNKFAGGNYKVTVAGDTTAPTATVEVESENKLLVTFSEPVSFNTGNVKVVNDKGSTISAGVSTTSSDSKYYINISGDYSGKTITVTLTNVKDKSLQENKLTSYSTQLLITDKTPPQVTNITKKIVTDAEQSLYIFFNEPVGSNATQIGNYSFVKNGLFTAFEGSADTYNDNKTIRISLTDTDKAKVNGGYGIMVNNVEDANGNRMVGQLINTINAYDATTNMPKMTAVAVVEPNKMEVTFDQKLGTVELAAFKINGSTPAGISYAENTEGNTVVSLIAPSGNIDSGLSNISGFKITINATASTLSNEFGVAASSTVLDTNQYKDKLAPKLATGKSLQLIDNDGNNKVDHIKVTFDEPMSPGFVSVGGFEVSGYRVTDAFLNSTASMVSNAATGRAAGSGDGTILYIEVEEIAGTGTDINNTLQLTIKTGLVDNSAARNPFEAIYNQDVTK